MRSKVGTRSSTSRSPKTPKTINEVMLNMRTASGKTQMEAAKFLGHSTAQYISNLERGLCAPSVEMAITLCEFYGGNRKELFELMVDMYDFELKAQFKKAK